MKFILLSVVCLLGAVVAQPTITRRKRDILRGDPRYGTEYHRNHLHAHQHHQSNEVEVSRALGGYVGSYAVPEISAYQNNINLQPLQTSYGPPNFTPGKPIGNTYLEPQIPQTFQRTVIQQQVPSFVQPSTISNFKTAENVETISNAYLSPVKAVQTPVPTYQPTVSQQEQHPVEQVHDDYLPPVEPKGAVLKPIDSYGKPIPAYGVPAVQDQQQDVVADVKSQATVSSEVSTDVVQDVQDQQDVQQQQEVVQQETSTQAAVDTEVHADTQVQTAVKTQQPQVNYAQHAVQPAVHHQVQKTVQHTVQHTQQPAVHQQTAQFPQFYTPSFTGYENFGSVDSGFQSYGTPSFGQSAQVYNSDFGNLGFGYQQDYDANVYQGGYSTGQVQQDSVHQFPQVHSFGQTQFPQVQVPQLPSFVPSQLPSFVPSQLPSFPSQIPSFPGFQQEIPQAVQQPAQPAVDSHSESISVENVNTKQVQPTAVHVNTHSNANSFAKQSQPTSSDGGYVY